MVSPERQGASEMKRIAGKMKLFPGMKAEYERRHREIWQELVLELKKAGISDYSIYLDEETSTLFYVLKLSDDNTYGDLPAQPVMRKWWDYMKDLMETNPDNSPVSIDLPEMFHLE